MQFPGLLLPGDNLAVPFQPQRYPVNGPANLPCLGQFLFCGEVLTHTLCDTLAQRFPSARILNTYGPTEATVLVTAAEITEEMRKDSRPIPIGGPIDGVTLRLERETWWRITPPSWG